MNQQNIVAEDDRAIQGPPYQNHQSMQAAPQYNGTEGGRPTGQWQESLFDCSPLESCILGCCLPSLRESTYPE
jgi:hypothetical protein